MNELSSVRSSYIRYKESTQKLVRWLVTTVSSIPSIPNAAENHEAPKGKKKGGGGRSKKGKAGSANSGTAIGDPVISIRNFIDYAKLIAKKEYQVAVPEAVFSLFESVIQARKMVAGFYKQLNLTPDLEAKNESHLNFIKVLEEAFGILGGTQWRKEVARARAAARKLGKPTVDENSPLHMSNRFAELEVQDKDLGLEEPEDEKGDTPESNGGNQWISHLVNQPSAKGPRKGKAPKPSKIALSSYKIREDLSIKEELSFAVWCFFVDMNSIRQYVKAMWNQVRKNNIDLVTASVGMYLVSYTSLRIRLLTCALVTSAAVEMVKALESTLQLSFPQLKEYPDLMRALLMELPVDRVKRLLDLLDFCLFFPLHVVCGFRLRVFEQLPPMGKNYKEMSELADQCGLNGRTFQTSIAQAEKIGGEADFLDQ